jgi:hypothetical protein
MAVAIVLDFPGATSQQYDEVVENMELGGKMPSGGIFHAAGPTDDGWRVVDVWESDEPFQRFAQEKIRPLAEQAGMAPPAITRVELHAVRDDGEDADPALVQVVRIDGMSADDYDAAAEQAAPGGGAPEGAVFHVAGPIDGGWFVADAWVSREARDRFMENNVGPALENTGATGPPKTEDLEVHNTLEKGD